jgi:hypothetical protein
MNAMSMETFLWTTLGAFLTLSIFSFLYKDNPFYKFAEHLVAGVSAGYFTIILFHNGLKPNLFDYLSDGSPYFLWLNSANPEYLIPALLGVLMWTRFSRKWSWVSRWPMAIYIGIGVGVSIPLAMRNSVNMQLLSTMRPINWGNFLGNGYLDATAGISQIIIFLGMLAALFYFFFSKEHVGVFNGIAKFGIGILMVGFGTTFGFTVMARISLFAQRIQSMGDWSKTAWADSTYLIFWFLVCGLFVVIGLFELFSFLKKKGQPVT